MKFFTSRFDRRQGTNPNHGEPSADAASTAVGPFDVSRQRGQASLKLPSTQRLRTLSEMHRCGQQMLSLLNEPSLRVLRVDIGGLKWVNSELLAQFARVHYRASQQGKHVILENASAAVREVFHVTRFDRFFELNAGKDSLDSWNQKVEAGFFPNNV